jgi:DNA-binding ferritin-like protein (Dps family)
MSLIEKVIGDFGDKRRWKEYRARVGALPLPYRTAVQALERYLLYFGATDGDIWLTAYEDLADLFERAAADGTPIREIVGGDPVDFAETFAANYGDAGWISKERRRLAETLERAEDLQGGAGS